MKKTLITLLALTGTASAAFTLDATLTSTTTEYDWAGNGPTSSAVSMVLSKDVMDSLDNITTQDYEAIFASYALTNSSNSNIGLLSLECCADNFRLTRSDVTTGTFVNDSSSLWTFFKAEHYAGKVAWDTATCSVLTFAVGSGGNCRAVLSVIDADNSITHITMSSANPGLTYTIDKLSINSSAITTAYVYSAPTWTNNEVLALAETALRAHNVPEPTTATLSLLALCGLAARRRRK